MTNTQRAPPPRLAILGESTRPAGVQAARFEPQPVLVRLWRIGLKSFGHGGLGSRVTERSIEAKRTNKSESKNDQLFLDRRRHTAASDSGGLDVRGRRCCR